MQDYHLQEGLTYFEVSNLTPGQKLERSCLGIKTPAMTAKDKQLIREQHLRMHPKAIN